MAFCSVSHVKLQINLHIPKKSSTFARKTCNMTETKRFKDIVVTEDLRDLLSEQGAAHGRAYMWQCRRGQIQFKYADNTYTMRRDDLLFSPANRLPDILNQSRDFRCTVFALDGKKTEDILYACLRKETDWIDKLHFVLRHPMIHLSPRQVKLIDSYRQLVHLYADETGRYRRRVAFLQGQSIIYELLSWVDEVMRPSGDSRTIVSSRMNQLYVAFLKLLDDFFRLSEPSLPHMYWQVATSHDTRYLVQRKQTAFALYRPECEANSIPFAFRYGGCFLQVLPQAGRCFSGSVPRKQIVVQIAINIFFVLV